MSRSPVAQVFAEEWPHLVAALMRDLGDLDLAEDCAQDAFTEAAVRWGPGQVPDRPGAWLLTTARRKAIDRLRRDRRFADRLPALHEAAARDDDPSSGFADDQLALIFGCCHPALDSGAQVALTLREVCGLSTNQIAGAFLTPAATMAKRLVRAKHKVRAAGIPFTVPDRAQLPTRLGAVLHVVYLIFTEGHASVDGADLIRGDLCDEARWLADLLARLLPDQAEVLGLGALLCFVDARRATRFDRDGTLVLLEDQDRTRWDRPLIDQGVHLLESARDLGPLGPYQVQAAIAAEHVLAPTVADTDWATIVVRYDLLLGLQPGPVVALNRAVAVAMADGPEHGLALLDQLGADGSLDAYRYFHAARADLLRRAGDPTAAATAYRRALALTSSGSERTFLAQRLAQVGG